MDEQPTLPAEVRASLPPVVQAYVAFLESHIALLRDQVAELQARVRQNSGNSSRPPSSDPPGARPKPKRKPSGRKRGGQKGHPGYARSQLALRTVAIARRCRPRWPACAPRCRGSGCAGRCSLVDGACLLQRCYEARTGVVDLRDGRGRRADEQRRRVGVAAGSLVAQGRLRGGTQRVPRCGEHLRGENPDRGGHVPTVVEPPPHLSDRRRRRPAPRPVLLSVTCSARTGDGSVMEPLRLSN